MSNDWTGEGYGADAPKGGNGGLFFRLKKKGEKARLRLVSAPYRYFDEVDGKYTESGKSEKRPKASWVAIIKEVGADNKPIKRPVIFVGGTMIYGFIKDLAENPEWGDPATYDIVIERKEEAGAYYAVQPLPKPMGPISDEEKALFAATAEYPELNYARMVELINTPRDGQPAQGGAPAEESSYDPFSDE